MKTSKENPIKLIQLVYCSTATSKLDSKAIDSLLCVARERNADSKITGILLYAGNSFFQVIEGKEDKINRLFASIEKDKRHRNVTVILKEPIARRSFKNWNMGHVEISERETASLLGIDSFPQDADAHTTFDQGRAIKLLNAFRHGSWRARIDSKEIVTERNKTFVPANSFSPAFADKPTTTDAFSYAFQPIVRTEDNTIFSYEALVRGCNNEPAGVVLESIPAEELKDFDERSRILAIKWAAHLGLCTHLNLNIMPSAFMESPSAASSVLDTIEQHRIQPEQVILEILENDAVEDLERLSKILKEIRSAGVRFGIDDFGAGQAGLNLLAEFQPDLLKLDICLVQNIHKKGPRQAIVRGIKKCCNDLGIEIIAEGVETEDEFHWLEGEGIKLFQGYLFAKPSFEELSTLFPSPGKHSS